MNNIAELQNKPGAIEKLGAQRYLYSQVKKVFFIHSVIAIAVAIVFPIIGDNFPTSKSLLAIIAIIYLLVEIFILDEWEGSKKETAAKIQELFDVEVLGINWNSITVGSKPEQEVIGEYQKKITDKNRATLPNWYPQAVSSLPTHIAQIVCQRANIWWDSTLRRNFSYTLFVILTVSAIILLWQNRNITLVNAITNLAPFVPLFQLLIKQVISHHKSAKRLDELKNNLNSYIESAINNSTFTVDDCTIRSVQDEIFRHRSTVQSVPDFFYKLFRKRYEHLMNFNADKCIEQLLTSQAGRVS